MSDKQDKGKRGEEEAVAHLQRAGYRIVKRNWRFQHLEIDIVAENEEYLVIAEVKTRQADTYGSPEEFVSRKKQKHLIRAAEEYVQQYPTDKDVRFDIITILLYPKFELEHIPEAFYP